MNAFIMNIITFSDHYIYIFERKSKRIREFSFIFIVDLLDS